MIVSQSASAPGQTLHSDPSLVLDRRLWEMVRDTPADTREENAQAA